MLRADSTKSADHYWQFGAIYLGQSGAGFVLKFGDL
jgi:hypothetical protein